MSENVYDHTRNNTLARARNVIDNDAFTYLIMFILSATKSSFNGLYDRQNFTLVVIHTKFMK